MTKTWDFKMTGAQLVSVIIDTPDGPDRIDIAIS